MIVTRFESLCTETQTSEHNGRLYVHDCGKCPNCQMAIHILVDEIVQVLEKAQEGNI